MSLAYSHQDGIAEIHFDDGKANVMSTRWFRELEALLDRAEKEQPHAVLFRGRAGMFSAGLDMKWVPTLTPPEGRELVEAFSGAMLRVWSLPIPTVAAVTGHAVAGGCVLASACDVRFALDGPYRVHMNEVLVGLAIPTWAAVICESAFPSQKLGELLLLARPFSPKELHALGVVQELAASEEDLLAKARTSARALAALRRDPYALSKARLRGPAVERAKQALAAETPTRPPA